MTVVLPQRLAQSEADRAVEQFEPWIRRQLDEQRLAAEAVAARAGYIPWQGRLLPLIEQPGLKVAKRVGDSVLVPDGEYRPAVERLMRREARSEITTRLDAATAEAGVEWTALRIGDMKTRWASCSPGGRMSFSWRLMLAPEDVLQSVIWHEVCHIEVADHSPRFWALLDQRWPSHRANRAWLTRHAAGLVI